LIIIKKLPASIFWISISICGYSQIDSSKQYAVDLTNELSLLAAIDVGTYFNAEVGIGIKIPIVCICISFLCLCKERHKESTADFDAEFFLPQPFLSQNRRLETELSRTLSVE